MNKLKYMKRTQLSKLDSLMKKSTLFFSYSYKDKEFVTKFYHYLKSEGFKIWLDYQSLKPSDSLVTEINQALIESSKNGHILLFISKEYINSSWANREMDFSLSLMVNENASILPIIIDENVDLSGLPTLNNITSFKININNFEDKKKELLKALNKIN